MYCNICGCEFDERTGVCPVCGWIVPKNSADQGHTAPSGRASSVGNAVPTEDAESETIVIQETQNVQPEIRVNRTPTTPSGVQGDTGRNAQPEIRVNRTPTTPSGVQGDAGWNTQPEMRVKQTSGGAPGGQIPSGGIPTAKTPQGQTPTSRVTVSADTDHLRAGTKNATRPGAGNATRPGTGNPANAGTLNATQAGTRTGTKGKESRAERKEGKKYQKDRRVKAKPKHLALKIALLIVLLTGVGVGVFFGIKALKKKQEELASIEHFKTADVLMSTDGARYVKSQVLLRGKEDVSRDKIQSLVKKKSAEIVGQIPISNDYQIKFKDDMKEEELNSIINEWKNDSLVASVSLHYVYGTQGGFKYTDNIWKDDNNENAPYGDSLTWDIYHPEGNNWAVESIWAPKVWDSLDEVQYKKASVGIIDTVFDTEHKDLTDRFVSLNRKGLKQDAGELIECNPTDESGKSNVAELYKAYEGKYVDGSLSDTNAIDEKRLAHGTHIAGIIGANMDDEFGITGVAQNAELRAYATSGQRGIDDGYSLTSAFEYKYALSKMFENDVRLVNISMNLERMDMDEDKWEQMMSNLNEDMEYFLQKSVNKGNDFLIVKSAGDNSKSDLGKEFLLGIETESVRNRILAVGAAECDYYGSTLAGYKKTETTNYGDRIDIYAPGTDVLSDIPGDRTEMRTGSSEAAAFVSGGCALVMGLLPASPMSEVKKIVLESCYYQVADTNCGYLNVYMATESAKNGGDTSGLRDEMQREIDNNVSKEGMVELTLSEETMNNINDPALVLVTATSEGKKDVTGNFDQNGTIRLFLEEGVWNITLELEGYETCQLKGIVAKAGDSVKKEMVLSAKIVEVNYKDLPKQEMLEKLLRNVIPQYESTNVSDGFVEEHHAILFRGGGIYETDESSYAGLPGYDVEEESFWYDRENPKLINTGIEATEYFEYGVKKTGFEFMEKNVFNLSDQDIQRVNKDFSEEKTYDLDTYYEFEDFYYWIDECISYGPSEDSFATLLKNQKVRFDGKYYYISFDEYRDYHYASPQHTDYCNTYEAKLEFKTTSDGFTYWSIYRCNIADGISEEGNPSESGEGSTEAKTDIKNAKVGDKVFFGNYEQDDEESNGKEPIEWRVLDKDGDRILVVSQYVLDCRKYNNSYDDTSWETCQLRKWLNDEFFNVAFSEEEKKRIPLVTIVNADNPEYGSEGGNDTEDRVFLLSIDEATKYFVDETDEKGRHISKDRACKPTSYAISQGATYLLFYREGEFPDCNSYWWLRSPGGDSFSNGSIRAALVGKSGLFSSSIMNLTPESHDYSGTFTYEDHIGVRPALWIEP